MAKIEHVEVLDKGEIILARAEMASGETLKLFIFSDLHFDSPRTDRRALIEDMHIAADEGYILLNGDVFDVMQGRYDPRRSWPEMRKEYAEKMIEGQSYLDIVVQDAIDFFRPFASKMLFVGYGNHELSVYRNSDTDLIQRLVAGLNVGLDGWRVYAGGYEGYLHLQCLTRKTVILPYTIRYFHGAGGEAPVTRGAIQTNRQAVDYPDADAVLNGHNHQQYIIAVPRERFIYGKGNPRIRRSVQLHVRTPSYATERDSLSWEAQTGKQPRVSGYVVLKLTCGRNGLRASAELVANG